MAPEFVRRAVVETRMWPHVIVMAPPDFDEDSSFGVLVTSTSFGASAEPLHTQTFIAEFPVEAFVIRRYPSQLRSTHTERHANAVAVLVVRVTVVCRRSGLQQRRLKWSGGTGAFVNEAARMTEVAERSAANLRWLDRAFDQAEADDARAVLIGLQADMWDPAAIAPGGDGISGYTEFVRRLATRSVAFGRPVLLINGDSHVFMADHPLADPTSPSGLVHHRLNGRARGWLAIVAGRSQRSEW